MATCLERLIKLRQKDKTMNSSTEHETRTLGIHNFQADAFPVIWINLQTAIDFNCTLKLQQHRLIKTK